LFPRNPDRVLRVTPKPPAQSTLPNADEIKVGICPQEEVLQTPVTPVTPMTPVSAEGFSSLYNQIKQDALTLNETSQQRLRRRVQKLANAGQGSFAEVALLRYQNQFLTRMNNEARVRRSTKSVVLGKGEGKVMSFEDIEEARAKRTAKEAIKDKGKRGRKRKSAVLEAESEPEAEPEVARAAKEVIKGSGKRGRKRKIAAQEAEEPEVVRMIDAPVPWRAPVAQMI